MFSSCSRSSIGAVLANKASVCFKGSPEFYNLKWARAWQNQKNLCTQRRLDQFGHPPSLISLHSVLFKKLRTWRFFVRTVKTLIRLGKCAGWSESSLGAHVILLVLPCSGSNNVSRPCPLLLTIWTDILYALVQRPKVVSGAQVYIVKCAFSVVIY